MTVPLRPSRPPLRRPTDSRGGRALAELATIAADITGYDAERYSIAFEQELVSLLALCCCLGGGVSAGYMAWELDANAVVTSLVGGAAFFLLLSFVRLLHAGGGIAPAESNPGTWRPSLAVPVIWAVLGAFAIQPMFLMVPSSQLADRQKLWRAEQVRQYRELVVGAEEVQRYDLRRRELAPENRQDAVRLAGLAEQIAKLDESIARHEAEELERFKMRLPDPPTAARRLLLSWEDRVRSLFWTLVGAALFALPWALRYFEPFLSQIRTYETTRSRDERAKIGLLHHDTEAFLRTQRGFTPIDDAPRFADPPFNTEPVVPSWVRTTEELSPDDVRARLGGGG